MNCPSCKSNSTQTIKMACLSGTTTGKSTVVGGMISNLDVGVAAINSRYQTQLAAMYSPVIKANPVIVMRLFWGSAILLFFISFIEFFNNDSLWWIGLVAALGFVIVGKLITDPYFHGKKIEAEEARYKLYEGGWICHKCGHMSIGLQN